MPNSLIFVVILAVWAAYLIQHWIRRRDHLATARSVDRFSEAMRVLERRQRMPRADLSAAAPRSYSVSVTRPAHPEVVVKRAQHGVAAVAPIVATAPAAARPAARPAARAAARAVTGPAGRSTARRPVLAGLLRARTPLLRAVALAVGVLALAVGVTVWAIGLTQWWAAVAGVATLLLALTLVRSSVGTQQRRATSPVRARTTRESPRARATQTDRRRPEVTGSAPRRLDVAGAASRRLDVVDPASRRLDVVDTASRRLDVADAAAAAAAPADIVVHAEAVTVELYDIEALDAATSSEAPTQDYTEQSGTAAAVESAELLIDVAAEAEPEPGTWSPVPVPPPTYTLKAKATRTATPAAASSAASIAVEDLPFDGHALALDEEFEELPAVHRVG